MLQKNIKNRTFSVKELDLLRGRLAFFLSHFCNWERLIPKN